VARGHEIDNKAAKLIFTRLASTNNDTLTSYVSLLMTSGLDQWQNPAIDEATQVSDFDFRTIRKKPFTVYLVVQPLMVKPLAPLIRLFFSDLLSAMQEKEPGKDEPWPVMIMLDEFNRLGKMPIVVESIETLRTYRGHLAVVTQTIPALDEIYGENTRRALQGNAGVKLYLTPSDEKTIEELSKAVGKTTKTVITRSRSIGKNPFEGRSQSTRTEETSLLPEDEARRLPLDEIIMVVDAQMPVRAKRIQYFDDRLFAAIHGAQTGELPFPVMGGGGAGVSGPESGGSGQNADRDGMGSQCHGQNERSSVAKNGGIARSAARANKSASAVQVVVEEEQRQMELNFADQAESLFEERGDDDRDCLDNMLDALDGLESQLKQGGGGVG